MKKGLNKKAATEIIRQAIWECERASSATRDAYIVENTEALKANLAVVARAFCGSWIGYHSRVYYRDFRTPAPGDHFSPEWGLMEGLYESHASEHWVEYPPDRVQAATFRNVDADYIDRMTTIADSARTVLRDHHQAVRTIVNALIPEESSDSLTRIRDSLDKIVLDLRAHNAIDVMRPRGQYISRDSTAVTQGILTPPHCAVQAQQMELWHPFSALEDLISCARSVLKYMQIHDLIESASSPAGQRVFIGHGRSPVWRELKDFLHDRLHLEWDEFNREAVAGTTTIDRLKEMVADARFAFLVMTAEDEHADKLLHARENVVHEVGLFQGALGFRKAIVLTESDCEEFSNITGLSQIRFPKGRIAACFEEVRRVLEREGVV